MEPKTKQFSSTSLLIEGSTVIKYERKAQGWFRQIYRSLIGGSLPFQNEFACYQANPKVFPNIKTAPSAKLILINFNNPTGNCTAGDITKEFVLQIGTEISSMIGHDKFGPLKRFIFRLINGPLERTLRDLKRSKAFTVWEKLIILTHLIRLHLQNRRNANSGRMIHNDLILHNILRFGGELKPIDFEDALIEPNWVFVDLTDLMFQGVHWSRKEMIDTLRQAKQKFGVECSEDELKNHFEFGFIRFHVRSTVMRRFRSSERELAAQRLRDWLNDSG